MFQTVYLAQRNWSLQTLLPSLDTGRRPRRWAQRGKTGRALNRWLFSSRGACPFGIFLPALCGFNSTRAVLGAEPVLLPMSQDLYRWRAQRLAGETLAYGALAKARSSTGKSQQHLTGVCQVGSLDISPAPHTLRRQFQPPGSR